MKLNIYPITLCRAPIFSSHAAIEEVWNDIKNYIEEASPAFFEHIKNYHSHELNSLEPKARFTLWKYFNRACFRPTPYGNFATFSLVPIAKEEGKPLFLKQLPIIHRFPDWSEKEHIHLEPSFLLTKATYLCANTSAYHCGKQIRYISFVKGTFELSEVNSTKLISATLTFCHQQRSLKDVQAYLRKKHQLDEADVTFLLEQFIELQLMFTDLHPNIIGREYFERISHTVSAKNEDYLIAERRLAAGQLHEKSLHILPEAVKFLCKYLPSRNKTSLNDFRDRFISKFEYQEIPLLTAIDPELGITYMDFEQESGQDNLVGDLKKEAYSPAIATAQPLNDLYKFILNQLWKQEPVQLENFSGPEITPQLPLANTLSSIVTFCDDLLITQQIGGATANSLLGRFSMASDAVTALGKEFVKIEEEANPDVLFFDIAYQAEKHVDNVNRRKSIYNYELPILTWTESKQVLALDDLMLSVVGDELILHSLKHQKRVVPRLASAYNYTRSDLTIFRFLSDLQYQGLNQAVSVNLEQILPGLAAYPRIQYKNLVLSAAKWRVPEELCQYKTLPLAALEVWMQRTGMDAHKYFKCGNGDQTLCFDSEKEADKIAFLNFCRNKSGLYAEEAFIPAHPLLKDEQQQPYLSEFIVHLTHQQKIYNPYHNRSATVEKAKHAVPSVFLPGGEWLYFEIYCHVSRANTLLQFTLKKFLVSQKDKINSWFFIRYDTPSSHLRLRLQLKAEHEGYEVMAQLSKALQPAVMSSVVSDLQIRIYRRENNRYGASRIALVERFFWKNSELIIALLKHQYSTAELYALSLSFIAQLLSGASYSLQQQIALAEAMSAAFDREMKIGTEGHKKINKSYKEFIHDRQNGGIRLHPNKELLKVMDAALEAISGTHSGEKQSMLTDLFHMHVNRLFYTQQRMHELVIYHYLAKILKTRLGRQKNASEQK